MLSQQGESELARRIKIDRRNHGPHGWIDRNVYYVSVCPEDIETARTILTRAVDTPFKNDELVIPCQKNMQPSTGQSA